MCVLNNLLRPVLSYGAHIWGLFMLSKWSKEPLKPNSPRWYIAILNAECGNWKIITQSIMSLEPCGKLPHGVMAGVGSQC
jgi:hypothetical protein